MIDILCRAVGSDSSDLPKIDLRASNARTSVLSRGTTDVALNTFESLYFYLKIFLPIRNRLFRIIYVIEINFISLCNTQYNIRSSYLIC